MTQQDNLFVGSANGEREIGLFSSSDRGETWTEKSATWESRLVSYIAQGDNGRMCTAGSDVFCSVDGGETWSAYSLEFPHDNLRGITIDSAGYVYVATEAGVFKSIASLE